MNKRADLSDYLTAGALVLTVFLAALLHPVAGIVGVAGGLVLLGWRAAS